MNLVIFDLDGTLANTGAVDDACIQRAFQDEFRGIELDLKWDDFPHATDSCVFHELFRKYHGKPAAIHDVLRFQQRFLEHLQIAYEKDHRQFQEVPGSVRMLQFLGEETDWTVAIATGGWKVSANFKLEKMGVDSSKVPAAFADDGISREEIIQMSIQRALEKAPGNSLRTIAYVGDGVWDATTTKNLGIPFIGIASRHPVQVLVEWGAVSAFSNFENQGEFVRVLQKLCHRVRSSIDQFPLVSDRDILEQSTEG